MVTNNKVLTVSYGTFSCTLEGFEDSFDTMKAIAEYFRDLAADDRYFGAEPPTPDAEMLARIAEREIERRVRARVDHGAIVLSATDAADTAAPAAAPEPAEVESAEAETANTETDTQEIAPEVQEADDSQQEVIVAETEEPVEEESVAADETEAPEFVDIAADAAPEIVAPTADIVLQGAEEDGFDDIAAIAEASETSEDVAEAETAAAEAADSVTETDAPGVADAVAEVVADGATVEEIETPAADEFVADTAAAVTAAEEPFDIDAEDFEDDVFDEAEMAAPSVDADDLDEPGVETTETDNVDDAELVAEQVVAPEAAIEEAAEDTAFDDWDMDEEDDVDPEYAENSIAAKLERIRAVVSRGAVEPEDDFSEDEHAQDVQDDGVLAETVDRIEAALQDDATEDAEPTTAEPAPQPLRARVVRMKKADFEEAVASGLLEAEPVDEEDDDAPATANGSSLTPEDEAELLAELAEVEAELAPDYEDAPRPEPAAELAEPAVQPEVKPEPQAEDSLAGAIIPDPDRENDAFLLTDAVQPAPEPTPEPSAAPAAEAHDGQDDLSRLMAKAESEMEEPEGNRRRRAIAHLRAAVKATKAEQESGAPAPKGDGTEAYRDDLANVVRAVAKGEPATPPAADPAPQNDAQPAAKAAPRKNRPSAAPLKLVAEQRIDAAPEPQTAPQPVTEPDPQPEVAETVETTPRVPVRPRRVSADRMDREEIARAAAPVGSSSSAQGDFLDYAQSVGAHSLPEVLEAAAAYLTFVEGHDRFSRPMLMRMARDANEAEFSREIGLRSFGQLLREKKIEKIAGGRFTAASTIGFQPDDRAVG